MNAKENVIVRNVFMVMLLFSITLCGRKSVRIKS